MCNGWQGGDSATREYAGMTRGALAMDKCIAPLLDALNYAGIRTVASCCGHGIRPGSIILEDGRELVIAPNFEVAREVDKAFARLDTGEKIYEEFKPYTWCPECSRKWRRADGAPVRHSSGRGQCFACLATEAYGANITESELDYIMSGPGVKETVYL